MDLGGQVREDYTSLSSDQLRAELAAAIERHEGLQRLRGQERTRFLSPALLDGAYLHPEVVSSVCKVWDTVEELLASDAAEFGRRMAEAGQSRLGSQFQAVRAALEGL